MAMMEVNKQRFALTLDRFMREKNIDQVRMAEKTGISQQTISQYLRALNLPSFNRMVQMARALDVSFFDLTQQRSDDIFREISKMRRK